MELAEVYLPDLHPRSAHRKLQHWITIYPGLPGRLLSLGYHEGERVYSPAMVRAIIESLGEPCLNKKRMEIVYPSKIQ